MQDDVGEDEVCKAPLWWNALEGGLVLRVDLKPEADTEDEWPHAGDESRQESTEGEGSDQATVQELYDPGQEHVGKVGVDNLQPLGGVVGVPVHIKIRKACDIP